MVEAIGMHSDEAMADPAYRVFVSYIDKSRDFYAAQGYDRPYRWARSEDAPFTPLAKPLSDSRIALVTTTTLLEEADDPDPDDRPPKRTYAAPLDPLPARLYTMDLSWHKEATHTGDLGSYFPAHRLQEAVEAGRIGSLSPRFYGLPTEYSQRRTNEVDAPQLLDYLREDAVDLAMLVPL